MVAAESRSNCNTTTPMRIQAAPVISEIHQRPELCSTSHAASLGTALVLEIVFTFAPMSRHTLHGAAAAAVAPQPSMRTAGGPERHPAKVITGGVEPRRTRPAR